MTSISFPAVSAPGKEEPREVDTMLDLFLSMLDVRLRSIEAVVQQDEFSKSILAEVRAGISKLKAADRASSQCALAWNEAYRLERLLALAEPPEMLKIELNRRLDEAIASKLSSATRLKADVDTAMKEAYDTSKQPPELKKGAAEILRNALNNLLEELHWDDQRKFYLTPILKMAVRQIVILGIIAFAVVIIPYVYICVLESFGVPIKLETWPWLALYTAISAGIFGAFFSRLIQILHHSDHMSIRELENAGKWHNLFLRGAVGMSGALVLFFFLKSGLIEGGMFPNFDKFSLDHVRYPGNGDPHAMVTIEPSSSLALLAIWSFLAGFSERLVPTILSNTESSFANSVNPAGKA